MTTEIKCDVHPEGHVVKTGAKFVDCYALLGKIIIDNVDDDDGLTYIYEGSSVVKRVKVGEKLSGPQARLSQRIQLITVSA